MKSEINKVSAPVIIPKIDRIGEIPSVNPAEDIAKLELAITSLKK